jgi:hypothetical protein
LVELVGFLPDVCDDVDQHLASLEQSARAPSAGVVVFACGFALCVAVVAEGVQAVAVGDRSAGPCLSVWSRYVFSGWWTLTHWAFRRCVAVP